jgi:hypothetical protein
MIILMPYITNIVTPGKPSENDVKNYFSKEFNVNKDEITVVNIQRIVKYIDDPTNYYAVEFIVHENKSYVYTYDSITGKYSQYVEYITEYPDIYNWFVSNYQKVPTTIDRVEFNSTKYQKIISTIKTRPETFDFNNSYFENEVINGSFYWLEVFSGSKYIHYYNYEGNFDFNSIIYLINYPKQKIYTWLVTAVG